MLIPHPVWFSLNSRYRDTQRVVALDLQRFCSALRASTSQLACSVCFLAVPTSLSPFGVCSAPVLSEDPQSCLHQPSVGPDPALTRWRFLQIPAISKGCISISTLSPKEQMGAQVLGLRDSGLLQTRGPRTAPSSGKHLESHRTTSGCLFAQTHLEKLV